MNLYIYWLWGMSGLGVVFADNETEARNKVIAFYKLKTNEEANNIMHYYYRTIDQLVQLEEVNNEDVIEVYEG